MTTMQGCFLPALLAFEWSSVLLCDLTLRGPAEWSSKTALLLGIPVSCAPRAAYLNTGCKLGSQNHRDESQHHKNYIEPSGPLFLQPKIPLGYRFVTALVTFSLV
jgi:hypothetical protein